jgi:chitin disaccharide deacetylase
MKKLIVNADDLGIDKDINRGIELSHQKGIVTSTSIIPGGDAFEDAVDIIRRNPGLSAGLHFTLVLSKPVSDPTKIPSLLKDSSNFMDYWYNFYYALLLKKVNLDELEFELKAQIGKLIDHGINPTHINGHLHLHLLPGVIDRVIRIAKSHGIKWIRTPKETGFFTNRPGHSINQKVKFVFYRLITLESYKKIKDNDLKSPQKCFGLFHTGRMNENALLYCLNNLVEGVNEIFVHPGISNGRKVIQGINNYLWEEELKAMMSDKVRNFISDRKIILTDYGKL